MREPAPRVPTRLPVKKQVPTTPMSDVEIASAASHRGTSVLRAAITVVKKRSAESNNVVRLIRELIGQERIGQYMAQIAYHPAMR
jgi:hypothetical protein